MTWRGGNVAPYVARFILETWGTGRNASRIKASGFFGSVFIPLLKLSWCCNVRWNPEFPAGISPPKPIDNKIVHFYFTYLKDTRGSPILRCVLFTTVLSEKIWRRLLDWNFNAGFYRAKSAIKISFCFLRSFVRQNIDDI